MQSTAPNITVVVLVSIFGTALFGALSWLLVRCWRRLWPRWSESRNSNSNSNHKNNNTNPNTNNNMTHDTSTSSSPLGTNQNTHRHKQSGHHPFSFFSHSRESNNNKDDSSQGVKEYHPRSWRYNNNTNSHSIHSNHKRSTSLRRYMIPGHARSGSHPPPPPPPPPPAPPRPPPPPEGSLDLAALGFEVRLGPRGCYHVTDGISQTTTILSPATTTTTAAAAARRPTTGESPTSASSSARDSSANTSPRSTGTTTITTIGIPYSAHKPQSEGVGRAASLSVISTAPTADTTVTMGTMQQDSSGCHAVVGELEGDYGHHRCVGELDATESGGEAALREAATTTTTRRRSRSAGSSHQHKRSLSSQTTSSVAHDACKQKTVIEAVPALPLPLPPPPPTITTETRQRIAQAAPAIVTYDVIANTVPLPTTGKIPPIPPRRAIVGSPHTAAAAAATSSHSARHESSYSTSGYAADVESAQDRATLPLLPSSPAVVALVGPAAFRMRLQLQSEEQHKGASSPEEKEEAKTGTGQRPRPRPRPVSALHEPLRMRSCHDFRRDSMWAAHSAQSQRTAGVGVAVTTDRVESVTLVIPEPVKGQPQQQQQEEEEVEGEEQQDTQTASKFTEEAEMSQIAKGQSRLEQQEQLLQQQQQQQQSVQSKEDHLEQKPSKGSFKLVEPQPHVSSRVETRCSWPLPSSGSNAREYRSVLPPLCGPTAIVFESAEEDKGEEPQDDEQQRQKDGTQKRAKNGEDDNVMSPTTPTEEGSKQQEGPLQHQHRHQHSADPDTTLEPSSLSTQSLPGLPPSPPPSPSSSPPPPPPRRRSLSAWNANRMKAAIAAAATTTSSTTRTKTAAPNNSKTFIYNPHHSFPSTPPSSLPQLPLQPHVEKEEDADTDATAVIPEHSVASVEKTPTKNKEPAPPTTIATTPTSPSDLSATSALPPKRITWSLTPKITLSGTSGGGGCDAEPRRLTWSGLLQQKRSSRGGVNMPPLEASIEDVESV